MTKPEILGQFSDPHKMMADLLQGVPSTEVLARFHPQLVSLGWYLGRSVYRELYWLREILAGDADLSARVRHIFVPGDLDSQSPTEFHFDAPLQPRQPCSESTEVTQGHYRIGSRNNPFAYDNELTPQAVELSSYRIAKQLRSASTIATVFALPIGCKPPPEPRRSGLCWFQL